MIEESAKVLSVERDTLLVECITKSACSGCASKSSCSSGVVSEAFGEKAQQFTLSKPVGAAYHVGDIITIGIPEHSLLQGAFLVYLLPLLLFVIAALCSDRLFHTSEPITILSAVLAAAIGYLFSRWQLKKSKKQLTPVILS